MNDAKLARHIIGELPSLVEKDVIDAGSAEALRRHYEGRIKPARSLAIALIISALLGGLLVGSGIILLLAHNWDDLSRPTRAFLAVLPLLISILLSGYAILRRMDSTAWREGCGVFYFLSIGASIALVSQTYHLYNDVVGFLFYWTMLALPVIYLLNSGAAFAGCLACLAAYSFAANVNCWLMPFSLKPFAMLALALPYYIWQVWKRHQSLTAMWISWALAMALPFMLLPFFIFGPNNNAYVLAVYGLLAVVYYLAGRRWFSRYPGFRNPFYDLGALGIVMVAILCTYKLVYAHNLWRNPPPLMATDWFAGIIVCAWLVLVIDSLRRKAEFNVIAAFFPVLIALVIFLRGNDTVLLLMNVYTLALGVFMLLKGVRRDNLLSMNQGMMIIAALILCRFFDSHYGSVARGLAFILAGCGFLAGNLLAINRRRKEGGSAP